MEGILLLVPGAVLCAVYLLQPLIAESIDGPWDGFDLLVRDGGTGGESTAMTGPDGKRAMTDGGRVCHSCGAHVEGDYLYCAECLTPRV